MRTAVRLITVGLFMLAAPPPPATAGIDGPVKTQSGRVSGVPGSNPRVTVFKGLPFAAPPVGDLRWREPQPAPVWTGIRSGAAFGPSCIQNVVGSRDPWTREFMTHGEVSEDCLFLNVWTPARTASARLPVLVYIYGGAFTEGSGMVPAYDGEGLAAKGLVVVNFNYRLGVFGFFAHPELTRESPHRASGNYGLFDQLAALRWVQQNIAAFGGDPGRVTIAGQSAGASSVHSLVASPLAKGLFHRAIAQSGSTVARPGAPVVTLAAAEQVGLDYAQLKGAATLDELRALSAEELLKPASAPGRPAPRFAVNVDGYLLPESIAETIARGRQNDVPFITGCNADEGGAVPSPTTTMEVFRRQAERYGELAGRFLALYPAATDGEAGAAQNASARDQARTSMYLWALQRQKTARTPVYTYYWNHVLPGPDQAKFGAFHSSEVPYVFDSLRLSDRPFVAADRKVADVMASYWANFAATGNPNGKGLPVWPAVTGETAETMQVGDLFGPIPVAGDSAKLEFFREALSRPVVAAAVR